MDHIKLVKEETQIEIYHEEVKIEEHHIDTELRHYQNSNKDTHINSKGPMEMTKTKSDVARSKIIHKYTCTHCNKSFTLKLDLLRHHRTHTEETFSM